MASEDPYTVLGVVPADSDKVILRAFRKLTRKCHPEVNPGDEGARTRYRLVSRAWAVLGDPGRRAEYDRLGPEAFSRLADESAATEPGLRDRESPAPGAGEGVMGVFPGSSADPGPGGGPRRGDDIRHFTAIGLGEAAAGLAFDVRVIRSVDCPHCRGTGAFKGMAAKCSSCDGAGVVAERYGPFTLRAACAACRGRGILIERACRACRGRGRTEQTERVRAFIPGGVASGSETRIAGKGHQGLQGGPPGDLILVTRVEEHPDFVRRGDHIYSTVPVMVWQAALGAVLSVPTLDGETPLPIPPGTQSGHRFRLAGRGMPDAKPGLRGDQIVEVRVIIPAPVDEASREAYRNLAGAFSRIGRE